MRGGVSGSRRAVFVCQPEERIPTGHPLRKVQELVREVLKALNHSFSQLYSPEGRPPSGATAECPSAAGVERHPGTAAVRPRRALALLHQH